MERGREKGSERFPPRALRAMGPLCSLVLGLAALLTAQLATPAGATGSFETGVTAKTLPSSLRRDGWRIFEVPGKATAEFTQNQPNLIEIRADKAVAFLYRAVDGGAAAKDRLTWRWRLDEAVPPTDLSKAPGDDRSLAVHVVFPMDIAGFSFWSRVRMAMTRMVAPPMAGKVLTYVWGGEQSIGSMLANPFFESRGKIIVLRNGTAPLGEWLNEEIDFAADYRKAFGEEPSAPTYIAISADSDDTGSRSAGAIADLAFEN